MKRHIFKPAWLCNKKECRETIQLLVKEYQEYYDKLFKKYKKLKNKYHKSLKGSKMKKLTKSKVWKVVSAAIRQQRPICEICDKKPTTQVHHVVHRNIGGPLYFDEKNLLSCCYPCHLEIDGKGRRDLLEAYTLLISVIGQERYDYLRLEKNKSGKLTQWQLKEIYDKYKKILTN